MRFVASIDRNPSDNEISIAHPLVHSDNVTRVWGDQPIKITSSGIIVIGSYNESSGPPQNVSDDPLHALLNLGWGDYIAIRVIDSSSFDILVSPSGALPCYVSKAASQVALGSDALTVLRALRRPITIDWAAVAFQLCFRQARTHNTALESLLEIPPGCVGRYRQGEIDVLTIWRPARFAMSIPDLTIEENAARLRQSVQTVISTMGTTWKHGLIGISGGLDSSIVAASCMTAGIPFDCFTMFEPDSDGDERHYARLLAAKLGKKLTECPYSTDDVDMERSSVASLPRPIGWQFQQSLDKACNSLASQQNADVVLRGTAGDAVFYASHTVSPIIDALRSGPVAGAATLIDVCRLHGCSVGTAARLTIRKLALRNSNTPLAETALMKTCRQPVRLSPHPWEHDVANLPPGRREHVRMLAGMQNFVEARLVLSTNASCPLFSQPVIETALSIPSRQWISGGVNRAVARMAFSDLLPAEIVRRRSKGTADGIATRLVETKHETIREMLMDGLLVENGVVDRVAVSKAMDLGAERQTQNIQRVLALADAEAWVRHWRFLA
jgi:asparagine synthase (glutamine-hydrolysing)